MIQPRAWLFQPETLFVFTPAVLSEFHSHSAGASSLRTSVICQMIWFRSSMSRVCFSYSSRGSSSGLQ